MYVLYIVCVVGHLDKKRHTNQKRRSKSVSPCKVIFFNLLLLFSTLFNYWIYRKQSMSISRVVLGNYISYYILYCVYYVHLFWIPVSPVVVDYIGYFILFLYCSILILHSIADCMLFQFEVTVVSLNALHVACCMLHLFMKIEMVWLDLFQRCVCI